MSHLLKVNGLLYILALKLIDSYLKRYDLFKLMIYLNAYFINQILLANQHIQIFLKTL